MTTATAKQLRNNLSDYLDRLQNGEEIAIIRHSQIIGVLKPSSQYKRTNGSAVATMLRRNQAFFASNRALTDCSTPTDQLYGDALAERYVP